MNFFSTLSEKKTNMTFFRMPVEYRSILNDSVRHSVGKFKENVLLTRAHYIHCLSVTSGTTVNKLKGREKATKMSEDLKGTKKRTALQLPVLQIIM